MIVKINSFSTTVALTADLAVYFIFKNEVSIFLCCNRTFFAMGKF